MVMTFRELAEELGVTAQAIHQQRKRNGDVALHCHKKGRTWVIDEQGQEIVRSRSNGSTQQVITETGILKENDELRRKIIELQDQVITLKTLTEKAGQTKLLTEMLQEEKEKLEEENEQLVKDLKEKNDELSSFEKSWFGLYRKVKRT